MKVVKRSLATGISYDEYHNKNKVRSTDKHINSGRTGVELGSFVRTSAAPKAGCQGVTKAGHACKARPVGDTSLCAGHTKQQESRNGQNGSN